MVLHFHNSYVTIDLDKISDNFRAIQEKAGVPVMAVVKADAYGHGAVPVARLLQEQCGFFGVSSMAEALQLRRGGIRKPILILGHTPRSAYPFAVREGIRPAIFSYEDAEVLSQTAVELGMQAPFHFIVDTGMSRLGMQVSQESADLCQRICQLPNLIPEGLFSHFATADCRDLTRAKKQAERFCRFEEMLRDRGVEVPLRHLNNSAGIMNFDRHFDMVRAGIVLYGMYPSDEVEPSLLEIGPALSWYSRVAQVKTLEAGREIGYGGTYTTEKPTAVATVAVGYADGYRRNLSGGYYVLIRGKKAPILGRICMDQLMVDVTDIPGVQSGDRVVLLGGDGDERISVEQIAAKADSFNYEFVCGIGRRVPRYYLRRGEVVQQVNYLLDEE